MAILKILTAPNPILRKKALPINSVDQDIRDFMDDMLSTMYNDRGIGLAANQVGILKRVIVLDLQDSEDRKRSKDFYPLFMANPEIIKFSEDTIEGEEGCLSVPEQRITVARPSSIKVKYIDYNNQPQELTTDGFLSRAIQHEIDHLNGKLIINYLSNLKQNVLLRKLTKIQKLSK